jgi:hypothetical protein
MTDTARALNQFRIHLRGVENALDEMLELRDSEAGSAELLERGIEYDTWVVLTRLHELYIAMRHRYLH